MIKKQKNCREEEEKAHNSYDRREGAMRGYIKVGIRLRVDLMHVW